jgi:hypothetical protein
MDWQETCAVEVPRCCAHSLLYAACSLWFCGNRESGAAATPLVTAVTPLSTPGESCALLAAKPAAASRSNLVSGGPLRSLAQQHRVGGDVGQTAGHATAGPPCYPLPANLYGCTRTLERGCQTRCCAQRRLWGCPKPFVLCWLVIGKLMSHRPA